MVIFCVSTLASKSLDHATQRQILLLPPSSETPEKTQQKTPTLLLSSQNAGDATQTAITYTYDSLYRLTDAVYSTGFEFHYTYDAVGNRLTQTTCAPGVPCGTTNYRYDDANRLIAVDGVAYTWDDNGNLLNDGTSTYGYDTQNRLTTLTQGGHTYGFGYNGNGDRLTQSVDGAVTRYTLDLEAGLTQVLSDGSYAYLYGMDRLAQVSATETDYFLGDALGSVRQLADASSAVRLAKNYEPYGTVMGSAGSGASAFGFDGEQQGGLTYLRARYLDNAKGIFVSRDSWKGSPQEPISFNGWLFVGANPIDLIDPTGHKGLVSWDIWRNYVEIAFGYDIGSDGENGIGAYDRKVAALAIVQVVRNFKSNEIVSDVQCYRNPDPGPIDNLHRDNNRYDYLFSGWVDYWKWRATLSDGKPNKVVPESLTPSLAKALAYKESGIGQTYNKAGPLLGYFTPNNNVMAVIQPGAYTLAGGICLQYTPNGCAPGKSVLDKSSSDSIGWGFINIYTADNSFYYPPPITRTGHWVTPAESIGAGVRMLIYSYTHNARPTDSSADAWRKALMSYSQDNPDYYANFVWTLYTTGKTLKGETLF